MPELPEVETISNGLDRFLNGKSFSNIKILDKKIFQFNPKQILNKKINHIYRRTKLIIFDLVGDNDLIVHLKMTGQFIYIDKDKMLAGGHQSSELCMKVPHKHTRVIFNVKNGGKLYYNDLRRFGWMRLMDKDELQKNLIKEFGPEPFSKEFNLKYFSDILSSAKKSNIKKILMDQKKISGIGNMYADEALYWAKIDPRRIAVKISKKEAEKLLQAIKMVLKKGIKYQGASIKDYLTCEGKRGKAQDYFNVYNKQGQKCKCGGVVKKIKLNGRGTHFCPKCQK